MNAKDVIKFSLAQSQGWLKMLLEDMKDAPTTAPTPKGGNHPLWVLGHVVCSEAAMTSGLILGEPNPLSKWDTTFRKGSQPVADASKYPSIDELYETWESTRAKTLKLLDSYSEADLDKPSKAPKEYGENFSTVGRVFQMVANHTLFHGGQVADARRAAGKTPKLG